MANTVMIEGIKVNADTGKPLGRPPKDPMKLAVYHKLKESATLTGKAPDVAKSGDLAEFIAQYTEDPNVTDAEILEKTANRFEILQKIGRGACEGSVRSLIVSGAGGVGKTHTIEEIVEQYIEKEGIQAEFIKGMVSPINLYMLLYRNRTKNCVTVMDDADAVFFNEDSLGILKAALDSSQKRKINWMSQSAALKENDVPTQFYYEGTMIFISNLDFQGIVDAGKGKIAPHLQALMTRAMYLDLKLHTPREVGLWIDYMVQKHDILVNDGLSPQQQEDVLDFISQHRGNLRNLSIRTALKLSMLVKSEPETWRSLAGELELKR